MEFEERNPNPEKKSSTGLPMVVLFVLIGIICLLLYIGWNMMSDDASKVSELKETATVENSTTMDSSAQANNDPMLTAETDHHTVAEDKNEAAATTKTEEKPTEKLNKSEVTSGETTTYTVKAGETFYGIANRFNISATTLKNANPDVDLNKIKVGVTKVVIPIQAIHTVGPGDVLRVVAKKYNITLEQLMAANNKTKNYAERGEKLIIPNTK